MQRLFKTSLLDEMRIKSFTQTQTEVFLDTLSLLAAIDGNVSPIEFASMRAGISYLVWRRDDMSCEDFLEARLNHHLKHRTEQDHLMIFADGVAECFNEDWIRDTLYICAARLALVDDNEAASESRMLDVFAKAFEFSEDHRKSLESRVEIVS